MTIRITRFARDPGYWGMTKRKSLPFAPLTPGLFSFSFAYERERSTLGKRKKPAPPDGGGRLFRLSG